MNSTAIIILHYKNDELTNQCIKSIRDNTEWGTYHIYIVDNDSPEPYKQLHPVMGNETVIRNDNNLSVSGMNFGFYHALYKGHQHYDYIVNFDNDIICKKNWLPPLIKTMEEDSKCGIVGGKQWDKEMTHFKSVGADMLGMMHRNLPVEKSTVLWMQGSFHMYRTKMMKKIGLHDERYKIICSDSDYCIHANDRGWKVVFVPDSNVIHIGRSSYPVELSEEERLDKIQFLHKWLGIKFCGLSSEGFKIDYATGMNIRVSYQINSDKTDYTLNGFEERPSTEFMKNHFNGTKLKAVEVGSSYGANARSLLMNLVNLDNLTLIDNDTDGYMKALENTLGNDKRINIINSSSSAAAEKFEDESLDFVYIDAEHKYEYVYDDIQAWFPKIKKNGVLAGHDYERHDDIPIEDFNVIDAVNNCFGKENIQTGGIDWWIVKR